MLSGVTSEDQKERVDRELTELLDEVRVAIPGAEVLFAFLLGVAFTERFHDVTSTQKAIYFATLLLTAASTALLIAPSAYHRIRFRDHDKERLLRSATKMLIGALGLLFLAVAGAVYLVGDIIYESKVAGIVGGLTAAWFVWFWFGLPLSRQVADESS